MKKEKKEKEDTEREMARDRERELGERREEERYLEEQCKIPSYLLPKKTNVDQWIWRMNSIGKLQQSQDLILLSFAG